MFMYCICKFDKMNFSHRYFLKGTWGQSSNFCFKWSFLIIKQNRIYKKFQKFTCKSQLTYFVCSFACMASLTQRLCHFKSLWKMVKNTIACKENQWWHNLYIRGMTSHTLNAKICDFITSRNLIESPQNFVQRPFSIQLTKSDIKTGIKLWSQFPVKI